MEWIRGRTLGRGSSATVSLADSCRSDDTFAVKTAELSRSEFLQREQRILSSLNSPHVVRYKGAEVTEEGNKILYNLLMEYVVGGTISDAILREGGRLKETMIGCYARDIVSGLEYLHSIGLAHCDIKGRNILVGEDGAKIGDLGCAKWVDSRDTLMGTGKPDCDRSGDAMPINGTPAFMAPEAARGEEQGFPADVWALGCTVIEMATGASPWPEIKDPVSGLYRIGFSGESPEIPSFLSENAKDFLRNCLRRDPKDRWTANQLLKHPFLEELNVLEKPNSNSPTTVLETDFWEEIEESADLRNHQTETSSSGSVVRRIRLLASGSGIPSWRWGESWITLRSNNNGDEVEPRDSDICRSVSPSNDHQTESSVTDDGNSWSSSDSSHVSSRIRNCRENNDVFSNLNLENIRSCSFIQYEEAI